MCAYVRNWSQPNLQLTMSQDGVREVNLLIQVAERVQTEISVI
jgi:hypothetical protein